MKKLLWLALISGFSALAQTTTKPSLLIITTGGTIASRTDAPLIEGPQLVQAVPELLQVADIEVEEYVRVGSSKMTPKLWLGLVQLINTRISEQPNLTGIVITHGTDTMEETSFFLNCTHRHAVPVVLVGSMRSSNMISADGPANLLNAARVAASPKAAGKGVLVVMNDNISAARDLRKTHNTRVDAFAPTEKGYIGAIEGGDVRFYRTPRKKHTTESTFDVYTLEALPVVDIIQDFAGFDEQILDFFLARESDGLVVSSFAGGRMSHGMDKLFELKSDQQPVVIASSIKDGSIAAGSRNDGSPLIIAGDLPANKARILLMLALTQTRDTGEIRLIFDQY
ncbi:MAG: asparaginase [Bacteroidota bacterium]